MSYWLHILKIIQKSFLWIISRFQLNIHIHEQKTLTAMIEAKLNFFLKSNGNTELTKVSNCPIRQADIFKNAQEIFNRYFGRSKANLKTSVSIVSNFCLKSRTILVLCEFLETTIIGYHDKISPYFFNKNCQSFDFLVI